MSQSPAMSDDSDFYGEEGDVEGQVVQPQPQPDGAVGDFSDEYTPATPASLAMEMDESPPASPLRTIVTTTVKRKLDSVQDEPSTAPKRQRVNANPEQYFSTAIPRTAGLPAEIWQYIFLYLTPDNLSCCLRVNKPFYTYLTSTTAAMSIRLPPKRSGLKLMDGESIWASARKVFAPNLPRPLAGFSEMQMFQLLGGKACQICGQPPSGQVNARTPYDAGPGTVGVRIIWSFSARMCGKCFDTTSLKDTEILQSAAAPLRAGLPHAFRTNDLHYIPASTLQANPASAPRGGMYKVYYRRNIDELQQEYEDAKEFGDAAAEEWVKGLPLNGKQQMADAARWERWEALHPPGTHPATTLREYFRPISAPPPATVSEQTLAAAPPAALPVSNGSTLPVLSSQPMKHPLPARVVAAPQAPVPAAPTIVNSPPLNGTSPQQVFSQPQQLQSGRSQAQPYRPPRNPKEVEEARAARKAEIERRCYEEFFPPLLPNVLQHMDSFRAAMIIVTPLTDQAWEVLKPRLYMQRDAAEQIEYQRGEQLRALQATIPDPSYRDNFSKSANEAAERQWEQQQGPVRKRLGKLAEDFIRGKWNGGKGLSRDTAPAFAVEVLLYARNKYVEDNTPRDQLNKEGPRSTSDPAFVSLENMRWLFDNKVKPLTEKQCRELFMCAECEGVTKGYAFEGMIQHFGAKHTTDFSQGNIVVHWQTADWPDETPFVPTIGEADPTIPENQIAHQAPPQLYGLPAFTGTHAAAYAPQSGLLPNLAPEQLEQLYAVLNAQQSSVPPSQPEDRLQSYSQGRASSFSAPQQNNSKPSASFNIPPHGSYQDQLDVIAKVARDAWDGIDGVTGMVESIRVQTVLDHVIKAFKARYNTVPTLDLIADALAEHTLMHPIKNAHPLACKTCVESSLGSTVYKPYHHRLADNEKFDTLSLIAHFKTVHLVGQDASSADWKEDMIEMADEIQVKSLVSAVGMDDSKLAIVAEAFPSMFPHPLPQIGKILPRELSSVNNNNSPGRFNKFNKKDKKKKTKRNRLSAHDPEEAEQSDLPEAGEDEYDPRRPAFIETKGIAQSRGRRSLGGAPGNGHHTPLAPSLDPTVFTPETLAALSKLAPALNLDPPVMSNSAKPSPSTPAIANVANSAAYQANQASQRAMYHPDDPAAKHTAHTHQQQSQEKEKRHTKKDRNDRDGNKGRNRRSAAGASGPDEPTEPEEDYTQIIRTAPANNGKYAAASLAQHPGLVPAVSPTLHVEPPRGRSVHPEAASYERPTLDQYGRPIPVADPYRYEERERIQYVDEYGRPIQYAPPPREEVRYVDQYGRPVEVVRVVERPLYDLPMYDYPSQTHGYGASPPDHEYGAHPPGPEYAPPPATHGYPGPTPSHEYGVHPPGPEYGRPPPEHGYTRPGYVPHDGRTDRVQYVDEYGRPIPYGPPAPY